LVPTAEVSFKLTFKLVAFDEPAPSKESVPLTIEAEPVLRPSRTFSFSLNPSLVVKLLTETLPEANVPMGQGVRSKLSPAGMGTQTFRIVCEVVRAGKMPVSARKDHAPV
jgi:hypothetical protein